MRSLRTARRFEPFYLQSYYQYENHIIVQPGVIWGENEAPESYIWEDWSSRYSLSMVYAITYELLSHILSVVVILYPYLKSLRIQGLTLDL
jgi:hypothetical protein